MEIWEGEMQRRCKETRGDIGKNTRRYWKDTRGNIGWIHVETLEGDTRIHESVDARQIGGQMDWRSMEA